MNMVVNYNNNNLIEVKELKFTRNYKGKEHEKLRLWEDAGKWFNKNWRD